jgi:AraC-like DNA-binding protein
MKDRTQSKSGAGAAPDFFSPQVSEARRFYLDLNPPRSRRLTVICGGVERSAPGYAIHRTTFPFYSIEYVARGRGTVRLQGRDHTLQPGRLFSYGPGIRHDIAAAPADPLVKYFVDFSGTAARQLLRRCKLAPGTLSEVFPPDGIQALFDELIQSGLRGTRHAGELCARLLECLALKISDSGAPLEGAETLSFTTYRECREHIQKNFTRLKTLQQTAQECRVDGAYLCRLFKRYDHQSPYRYLLRLKMNLAAERLQQPGALAKQVAEQVGFSDPLSFSRAFKGVFGLSPQALRKLRFSKK